MPTIKKLSLALLVSTSLVTGLAHADDKKDDKKFINDSSYAMGVMLGKNVTQMLNSNEAPIKLNAKEVQKGLQDSMDGKAKISDEELQNRLMTFNQAMEEAQQKQAHKAIEEGKKFQQEFKKQDGVKETKSGLLYKIEKEGKGEKVNPEDTVKVNYKGTLINGEVFDSTEKRGPIKFQLNQLIPGWVEGIAKIKKGGKIKLVVPPKLAYGEQDQAGIPANSTLVFDIELVDVEPAEK